MISSRFSSDLPVAFVPVQLDRVFCLRCARTFSCDRVSFSSKEDLQVRENSRQRDLERAIDDAVDATDDQIGEIGRKPIGDRAHELAQARADHAASFVASRFSRGRGQTASNADHTPRQ